MSTNFVNICGAITRNMQSALMRRMTTVTKQGLLRYSNMHIDYCTVKLASATTQQN
jgi:hypothetical protein